MSGRWWICTDALARNGRKILGPFESQELALQVRTYVEKVDNPVTYWVDEETDVEPGGAA